MNKHGRKHGISAHKFMIEIHMTKVELKLAHQCRISVIFKRGEHKKETVNAPVLDKGIAYFDERLAVPSIFYFDESKNSFLSKEATLALNMISSKAQRLMGVTKFDLSVYLNNNVKETNVDLKMEKCFDKAAKFHFRLKMTQLGELDPCMSFKEDEGATSQIFDEHNRQSPSGMYFAEKNPDLSNIGHADHSDFGEGRSISPRPESMDGALRRDTSPIDRSVDEKATPKKGTKPSPQSYRERASPRPGNDDNLQKSKAMQQKGRQMLNNKKDQIVDDTPRFQNSNQKRPASPFEQGHPKSAYSPHSDEIEQVRRLPTPTELGDARQIKENTEIKESRSTDNLRTANAKEIATPDRNSPYKTHVNRNKNFAEENQDTGSDSTEQYKVYERLVKEGGVNEERLLNTRQNDRNIYNENIPRDEISPEESDKNKQNEKRVKKWRVTEEDTELGAGKDETNKFKEPNYREENQEIDSRLSERNQPYEMRMQHDKDREEHQYLEVAESEKSSSYEKLEQEHKPREETRKPDIEVSDKNRSYEKLAKEYKQQLDISHEEYLALSQKYEDLKQAHTMLQIDYQTLQKGITNDRKSEKRADFELNIFKEKVATLQRELLEQKAQNENLLKNQRSQQSQHSKESKEAHDNSLDSETSDRASAQNQDSLQLKRYEDIITSLRNELSDVRIKYEESQAQLQTQILNNGRNNSYNERQTQSQTQNQNYNQILQQHQQHAFSKELEKSQITISELTSGINKLRRETEQKDTKIESLEGRVKELEDEVQFLKLQEERSKIQSLDLSDQSLEKINFDPKGSNETPETLQKTIQDLMVHNHGLKKEVDQLKKLLSLNNLDREKQKEELVALSRKNEGESEFEKKIAQFEAENTRLASELKKAKMGWAAADIEKYNSITASKESLEKAKKSEERVDTLEIDIFKLKSRLAELVNAIMEFGGVELLDKVEDIVSLDKTTKVSFREDLKKTVLS